MSSQVRTSSRRATNTIAAIPGAARGPIAAPGAARGPIAAPSTTGAGPRRWLILAVVALAQLMVVLDATIVNIALPSAQHALHFSNIERQWVVTAYALAFGSLLLLGGRLTDIIGRKATFIAGLIGFAGASAVGGAARSFGMLVAARACQGAFGALLAPAALSLLTTTFEGTKDRGKAFGVFGAIAGAGGAVGLLLGGLLSQYLDWRWCLYVNLVFAMIAGPGAVALLRRQPSGPRPRLDLPGLVAEASGMFCIVYGFSNAAGDGWHAPATWGFLAAGVVLLAAFAYIETRASQPLLPLRIVLDRNRGASYLSILITGAGMFGIFLFLTYYLQETLGFSPVMAGLAFLPMAGAIIVSANLANIVLLPRIGPRLLVAPGMLAAAAGLAWLTRIGVHSSYAADVLPPLLLASAGLGFVMSPSMNTGTARVAASDAGVASAMVNTGQQVGGSIGTSLLNTVAASAAASYLASHASPRLMADGRPAPALVELAQVHSYTTAFWWAAVLFAAGSVLAVLLFRSGAPAAPAAE
jgi:EmrB/QacA subfamily drug resistance transporter